MEHSSGTVGSASEFTTLPCQQLRHFPAEVVFGDAVSSVDAKIFPNLFPRQVEKLHVADFLNLENDIPPIESGHVIFRNVLLSLEDQKVCQAILEKASSSELNIGSSFRNTFKGLMTSGVIGFSVWCSMAVWVFPWVFGNPSPPDPEIAKARCSEGERFTSDALESASIYAYPLLYVTMYFFNNLGQALNIYLIPNCGESHLPRRIVYLGLVIGALVGGLVIAIYRETYPIIIYCSPFVGSLCISVAYSWVGLARPPEYALMTKTCSGASQLFLLVFLTPASCLGLTLVIYASGDAFPKAGFSGLGVALIPLLACRIFDKVAKDFVMRCHNMPVSSAATWTFAVQLAVVVAFRTTTMDRVSFSDIVLATTALVVVESLNRLWLSICLADHCNEVLSLICQGDDVPNGSHWTHKCRRAIQNLTGMSFDPPECRDLEVTERLNRLKRVIRIFELDFGSDVLVEYVAIWIQVGVLVLTSVDRVSFEGPEMSWLQIFFIALVQIVGEVFADTASSTIVHRVTIANTGEIFSFARHKVALASISCTSIATAALGHNLNWECMTCRKYDGQSCRV